MDRPIGGNPPFRVIGQSVRRVDALDKVTGRAVYPGDLSRPGMLHMKVLFSGRPHAKILAIHTEGAERIPGVVCILTGKDVPVNSYGLAFNDQPVLCDQVVRFEGDQVALVVAEKEEIATQARDLIEVEYEDLPCVDDPRLAMQPEAPQLHEDYANNVLDHIRIRKGSPSDCFETCDVVVESEYYLPMQEHAYLQPEAGLAYMDGEVVVVETAGQWAHHDQRQIERSLNLPEKQVRVIYRSIGGAFGGREDISVQIILALAAWKTGRPVKIVWSRQESILGHGKRHQMYIAARWGANRAGKVLAAQVEVISDAGAYAYTSTMVLGHAALTCTGVYDIPNVKVDAYAVYTNNVPGAAFRGFGSPQGGFAAEMQMNKIASVLGMDPVSIREINLLRPGELLSTGAALPESINLHHLLSQCATKANWERSESCWMRTDQKVAVNATQKYGSGIAIMVKNIGFSFGYPEESTAVITLQGSAEIEEVEVRFAGAECGQGIATAIQQMAAEALGVSIEKVFLIGSDTGQSPEAGSASASRLTMMGGNAIRGAAREALQRWVDENRPAIGTFTYHAPSTTNYDPETGRSVPHVVFSPIAEAVEVLVDTETGSISVPRVISVVDVGRAINPVMLTGQVEGAVVQALGYSVMENFITERGHIQTPDLTTYLIPTVLDVPDCVESQVVEHPDPIGPWGARGVGETPFIAVAPALAGAIHDATGIFFDRLPLIPQTILNGIRDRREASPIQIHKFANDFSSIRYQDSDPNSQIERRSQC
jgi:CO/xanthine dehydrogenase Mo-binding subunit